jgi:hypothetical protein
LCRAQVACDSGLSQQPQLLVKAKSFATSKDIVMDVIQPSLLPTNPVSRQICVQRFMLGLEVN